MTATKHRLQLCIAPSPDALPTVPARASLQLCLGSANGGTRTDPLQFLKALREVGSDMDHYLTTLAGDWLDEYAAARALKAAAEIRKCIEGLPSPSEFSAPIQGNKTASPTTKTTTTTGPNKVKVGLC